MDYKHILDTIKAKADSIKNPEFLQALDKQKINSILAVAGLIILLDIFFLIMPQMNRISREYLPKKRGLTQQLAAYKKGIVASPDVQVKLQQLETNVEETLSQLTSEKDIPEFLSWISALANDSKVKLMEIKPLKGPEAGRKSSTDSLQDKYYLLPVQLNLEAGYHQLGSFLNKLEQGKYFVRVIDLIIRTNPKNTVAHDINLRLETLILKER